MAGVTAFVAWEAELVSKALEAAAIQLGISTFIHDMRAPSRAITGYGELIRADTATHLSPESRDFLARTKTATLRMDELICDVLNYSRVVRQGLDLHPVDLGNLLSGIIDTYPAFKPPKAHIHIASDLPPVQGNEAALMQ